MVRPVDGNVFDVHRRRGNRSRQGKYVDQLQWTIIGKPKTLLGVASSARREGARTGTCARGHRVEIAFDTADLSRDKLLKLIGADREISALQIKPERAGWLADHRFNLIARQPAGVIEHDPASRIQAFEPDPGGAPNCGVTIEEQPAHRITLWWNSCDDKLMPVKAQ